MLLEKRICRRRTCCCTGCTNRKHSTILWKLNDCLLCCPFFRCCARVPDPKESETPSLFSSNHLFSRNIESRYTLICCIFQCCKSCRDLSTTVQRERHQRACCCRCPGRVPLTLFTSLFIWYNLPLEVVINRVRLLFSTASQLVALLLEWIFFWSVLHANFQFSEDGTNTELHARGSILYVTTVCMFLPEVMHALYMIYSPGYVLRSNKRKCKQCLLSLFSFARPLYELVWSFKFSQILPYTTLQNQGLIMSDSGKFFDHTGRPVQTIGKN